MVLPFSRQSYLSPLHAAVGSVLLLSSLPSFSQSADSSAPSPVFYVKEYRISGSTKLSTLEIQQTVYPYLGPGRTADDVEQARIALEKAYRAKNYQTVSVIIPQQDPRFGLIRFEVIEGKVARLRINGAKWFLPSKIRQGVPSLAEGEVPDLNQTEKEIIALNRLADRRVTPSLKAGAEPGTVDIDLTVEDKRPLHGSLELNNRYSADTTKLRLNGALSYGNLWQLGHTIGTSFQLAPENTDDSLVYSAYYLARVNEKLSLMLTGTKQESDISTLGGTTAVAGAGEIVSLRAMIDVPPGDNYYQTFSLGLDWKNLDETTSANSGLVLSRAPIEYFPFSANYSLSRFGKDTFTDINLTATLHMRGFGGTDDSDFDSKRIYARGSFFYLRGDISHTIDLKDGTQLFGKIQGQLADGPLVNAEQIAGGGLGNARGYLESQALGDNGLFGTLEYRTPSFIGVEDKDGKRRDEWRIHAFLEGGVLGIYDALPGQDSTFTFASFGVGTRFKYAGHYNGSVDLAFPMLDVGTTEALDPMITFRGWADF